MLLLLHVTVTTSDSGFFPLSAGLLQVKDSQLFVRQRRVQSRPRQGASVDLYYRGLCGFLWGGGGKERSSVTTVINKSDLNGLRRPPLESQS